MQDHQLPQIRLHDLRHSHATHLLAAGVHPKIAQERLGHSSIAITMDTYSHAMPNMQADAAARIDAAMQTALNKPRTKRGGLASKPLANGTLAAKNAYFIEVSAAGYRCS